MAQFAGRRGAGRETCAGPRPAIGRGARGARQCLARPPGLCGRRSRIPQGAGVESRLVRDPQPVCPVDGCRGCVRGSIATRAYCNFIGSVGAQSALFHGQRVLSLRRYPEAMAEFSKVLEQTPDYVQAKFLLASANLFAGRHDDARKLARAAALQAGQNPETVDALMQAYANPALRNAALPRVAGLGRIGRQHGAFARAYWYSLLGAREQAIVSLQRWVEHAPSGERFFGIIFLSKQAFDPIRDDPRFKAVLVKLGLPYRPDSAGTN